MYFAVPHEDRGSTHPSVYQASAFPGVPIYGGSNKVAALTNLVKDKDEFTVGDTIQVKCVFCSQLLFCSNC